MFIKKQKYLFQRIEKYGLLCIFNICRNSILYGLLLHDNYAFFTLNGFYIFFIINTGISVCQYSEHSRIFKPIKQQYFIHKLENF